MKKRFDVLLAGYYGFNNLGDELLCEASVKLLQNAGIDSKRIAVLSANPEESEKKFGIAAFNRWSLKTAAKAISESRVLLFGGGGLFQDATSARSCVYYYALIKTAKLLGVKVFAASQSVGPLHGRAAKFMTRSAFASCSAATVRDANSLELLKSLGAEAELSQDLVFAFADDLRKTHDEKIYLNFNARPHYEKLAEDAADSAASYAKENNLKIRGIAFSEEDETEMQRLEKNGCIKFDDMITVKTLADFSDAVKCSAASLGMRLHFTELSYMSGIPVCGCAYDPKVSGFCRRYGISVFDPASNLKFTVSDVNSVESRELSEKFCDIINGLLKN